MKIRQKWENKKFEIIRTEEKKGWFNKIVKVIINQK